MKNLLKITLLVTFMTVAQASHSEGIFRKAPSNTGSETISAVEARNLINRLEEIKAMDKSRMTRSEKRALRLEVKASEKQLNSSGGVYLSVGAVIIIILLLILLL